MGMMIMGMGIWVYVVGRREGVRERGSGIAICWFMNSRL